MFRQLTNFGHQRSVVQAIGFYLVYLVAGVLGIALAAGAVALISTSVGGTFGFDAGLGFGSVLAVVMTAVLSLLVLRAKGLFGHVGYLLVGLLSLAGAVAGGLILGLIFVAFLTTRPTRQAASLLEGEAHPIEAASAF